MYRGYPAGVVTRRLTWSQVWQRRLAHHWLARPASRDRMLDVVAGMCGVHAQVMGSSELSLGMRVDGFTRENLYTALWETRSLVKTYGLRGTLHIFPSRELGL